MSEIIVKECSIYPSEHNRPVQIDYRYATNREHAAIVIFSHGFKGFKDWGHFNMVANRFANAGFVFVKFNFSHNGTTPQTPCEFTDLEAFGNNNLSIELSDLSAVTDWVTSKASFMKNGNTLPVCLMGHSRGGGISIIRASEDNRISRLVTWSSVSGFDRYLLIKDTETWKKEGVMYVQNARTKQEMPMYAQFLYDYIKHRERFDVMACAGRLRIPALFVHGNCDEAVPFEDAQRLHNACPTSELLPIEGAGHTFGATHPLEGRELPAAAEEAINQSILFLLRD